MCLMLQAEVITLSGIFGDFYEQNPYNERDMDTWVMDAEHFTIIIEPSAHVYQCERYEHTCVPQIACS
jgi:hypothetical protein